ncbi:MAG TPA: CoA-binding protein [Syntrophorhabdaceae bacterium]|nr:CoA-binding protein [Syntrophorhabdaceae bacterium]HPU29127.1 CoA-binding protein [Syntrophorhabdaceae bacterium]
MTDEERKELLKTIKTIAVVGISKNETRPSYVVARYLKSVGYKIIPVNPKYDEVLGERCFKKLSDIEESVDVVDIFMGSDKVLPVVEEAIKIKPKCIWLQLGIKNEEAKRLAEEKGIKFEMDRCIKIEHASLIGTG